MVYIFDPRYEWSIFSGPRFQTLPSRLLIGSKNVARGKLWQNPRDELQNRALVELSAKALHEAPYKALPKLCQNSTKSSTKGFVTPLPTQYTSHAVK